MQTSGLEGVGQTCTPAPKEIRCQGAKRSEDRVWSMLVKKSNETWRLEEEGSRPAEGTAGNQRIRCKPWTCAHAISGVYRCLEAQFGVFFRAHSPENKMSRSNPPLFLALLTGKRKLRRRQASSSGLLPVRPRHS